jgi:CubicO group peptidase (beta-lactamase class C family)
MKAFTTIITTLPALAVVLSGSAMADAPSARPEEVGLSGERLERVGELVERHIEAGSFTGAVTLVARDGHIAHLEAQGLMNLERDQPMVEDGIFRIMSMTKPIVGVAMMMLYEEGYFSLQDPVALHIPELADLKVFAGVDESGEMILETPARQPTIEDLMRHTAGFTYGLFGNTPVDQLYNRSLLLGPNRNQQSFIDTLATLPLLAEPGETFIYSVATDVQGYLIEKWTGMEVGEFLRERIFEPLGMVDTAFYVPAEKASRLARQIYEYGPNGELVPSAALLGDYSTPPGLPSGGGGLVSTASDYMRFARMLLNGGELDGERILSPDTVAFMHQNHAPTTAAEGTVQLGPGMGFGMDVAVFVDPAAAQVPVGAGTYWWAGAGGTWFWIDPVNDLAFVGMAQNDYFDIVDIPGLTQQWVYQGISD